MVLYSLAFVGGFDLAAEWMGWENVFHCEWNEFGKKILKYYWPNAISYGDITKTDFTVHRGKIDILTGGFPCQPYSLAGKRKGKEDERHLWPEMLRSIREIQPDWVVGENVPGIINWSGGLVFNEVQTNLETEGYEVLPVVLPACGVNAPHRRDRVWFVAKRINANPSSNGVSKQNRKDDGIKRKGIAINEQINGRQQSPIQFKRLDDVLRLTSDPDTSNQGLQGNKIDRSVREIRQEREQQSVRPLPPDWQEFPTQSPLCSRNDGVSTGLSGITFSKHRNESIKAYGNAIVPQVAFQIFKAIEAVNNFVENNTYR